MSRAGYAPNKVTYCALIAALGREGPRGGEGSVQAFELWKELEARNVELDAAAIRTGMKACVGVGDLPAAEALLSGLLSGAHPAPPDARAFNIVLSGHARAGDVEGMERTLRALCAADVPASDVTYNTLVDGYARAGRPAAARDVLASAAAAGRRLGARPHASLVHAAAAAGDAPALGAALEAMAVGGLPRDAMTWGALVGGAAARGDLATARADLREMLAAGHAPSHALFNGLLGACGVARSPGAAREVLADMRRAGLEPRRDAYLALASGLARVGMWHAVLDTWSEQHRRGVAPDVRMHTLLTQAYGRVGRLQDAARHYEAALAPGSAGGGGGAAAGAAGRGAAAAAPPCAPLPRGPRGIPVVDLAPHNAMVDACAQCGDLARGREVLRAAVAAARAAGRPPPVEGYGALVAGHARARDVRGAVALVRAFHAGGGRPDAQMLDTLATLCVRTGEFRMGMQALRALERMGVEVDKSKYRQLLEGGGRGAGEAGKAASRPLLANEHLERLKFWLGLPNNYYEGGWGGTRGGGQE
ncbi:TCB1 [Auxenochlorella protothecoides x Auxenochlorella symbiontica]